MGENITRQADVRVIAATNRDLDQCVAQGRFREDLLFRLNVIGVEIPPLRRRPEDLLRFANHYLQHFSSQCARPLRGFTEEAEAWIRTYSWPGNLRELRNAVERAVILARQEQVTLQDLPVKGPFKVHNATGPDVAGEPVKPGAPVSLEAIEEAHIRSVLEWAENLAEAAQILGIDQATLYRRRKKLGLGKPE